MKKKNINRIIHRERDDVYRENEQRTEGGNSDKEEVASCARVLRSSSSKSTNDKRYTQTHKTKGTEKNLFNEPPLNPVYCSSSFLILASIPSSLSLAQYFITQKIDDTRNIANNSNNNNKLCSTPLHRWIVYV